MTTPLRPEFQTDLFQKGLAIRREVVGDAYVEKSLANANDFTAPLQKLVTEWCWGEVWSREGLDRRTRSFVNLGMLVALNRPHELRLHVQGALNNGATPEEIREVVLQVAIYCGVPAALDSMRVVVDAIGSYVPPASAVNGEATS
jgi:4-carboxymuconolactone decarboxylase